MLILRTSFIVLHLLVCFFAVFNSDFLPHKDVKCREDFMHLYTRDLNKYFAENVETRKAYMIMCGLLMDSMVFMIFIVFALKGTTWRIVIALAVFQLTKYFCAVRLNRIILIPLVNIFDAFARQLSLGLPRLPLPLCQLWQA